MALQLLNLKRTFSQSWVHTEDTVNSVCTFVREWWHNKFESADTRRTVFKCLWQFCPPLFVCFPAVFDPPAETTTLWPSAERVTSVVPSAHTVWSRRSSPWRRRRTVRSVATPPKGGSAHSCSSGPQPRTPPPAMWATKTSRDCPQASCPAGNVLPWQQREGGQSPGRGWRRGRGGGYPGRCTGWGKGSGGRSL